MMNYTVILFKDSDCDLCKLMQTELVENPPDADVEIVHVSRENCSKKAELFGIDYYPTTIIMNKDNVVSGRFLGFIDSNSININIKEYEAKCFV